jgi:PAS domain S-box-containing protein
MDDSVRVLHVDDDPELESFVATMLERADDRLSVATATNVDAGMDRFDDDIDCVVSDYDMPGRDGLDFLEAVRDRDPDRPFIMFTGTGSEAVASEAISAGVTDYLEKESGAEQYQLLAKRVLDAVDHRRARTNYRELFEQSPDGIVVQDPDDGSFVDMNETYADLFGYDREACIDAGFEALHPDEPPHTIERAQTQVRETLAEGPRTFEWPGVRRDGERVWTEVHLAPIRLGGVDRVLTTVRDVTARKERERERRRTTRRYRAIFNDPNILAGLLDYDGAVLDVNDTAMAYVDALRDDVTGVPFWETPWFAQSDAVQADLRTHVDQAADGEYVEFETSLVDSDGETRAIEGGLRPVTDDDGEVVSIVVSAREVTERRARERELERIRDFFTEAERLGNLGAWEFDVDGNAIWTDGTRRIHGVDDDFEPTVEAGLDFIHPADREEVRSAVESALAADEPYEIEARLITTTGDTRWIRTSGESIGEDTVRGYIQDVTERKEYERRLERQNDRLDAFASLVSHDLRNPLTVAQGRLQLLRSACDCGAEGFDDVERAHGRIRALIDDLLALARQGKDVDETEPVDLSSAVTTCWQTVDTAGAALVADVDCRIEASRSQLKQLLENLIRNSVEHGSTSNRTKPGDSVEHGSTSNRTKPGDSVEHGSTSNQAGPDDAPAYRSADTETDFDRGAEPAVTVTVGELADGFYVADDGPGIPESERETVFEPGHTTLDDGTGFGLSIVKRIADAHGWAVSIRESDAGGARFEITGIACAGDT